MKGQSSTEFVLLVGFALLLFAVFLVIIQSRTFDGVQNDLDLRAAQVESVIENEVLLAFESVDGYERFFFLPTSLNGVAYEVRKLDDKEIAIIYPNGERLIFLPDNVTLLNLSVGWNVVSRGAGVIFLADASNTGCLDTDGDLYNGTGVTCNPASSSFDCNEASPLANKGMSESSDAVCSDGLDNDCDFFTDCFDSGCSLANACRDVNYFNLGVGTVDDLVAPDHSSFQTQIVGSQILLVPGRSVGEFVTPYIGFSDNLTSWETISWNVKYPLRAEFPVHNDMRAYFTFEGNDFDQSFWGNDFSQVFGGPNYTVGMNGLARNFFDGSVHQYLFQDPVSGLDLTDFSVSFWADLDGFVDSFRNGVFRLRDPSSGQSVFRVFLYRTGLNPVSAQLRLQAYDTGGIPISEFVSGSVGFADGVWRHFVVTYDYSSRVVEFFVDGSSFASFVSPSDFNTGASTLLFGAGQNNIYQFNGSLDEFSIWNRSLSAAEVLDIYNYNSNRLKYQVCSTNFTSGECEDANEFFGPDGTLNTYFEGDESFVSDVSFVSDSNYLRIRFHFFSEGGSGSPVLEWVNVTGLRLS